MVKTVNRKSLGGRRFNVLIYGHQRNQASNEINLRSVLRPSGTRTSGTRVMHRIQLIHTISLARRDRRANANSSRPGFISRHQTLRSLNFTCRVVGSSHSWLQGRQSYIYLISRNLNIRTSHTYNFTELTPQDNPISRSKNEKQMLKAGKDTKPLCSFDQLKSMATPSSSTQIASSSQHLRKEKDTTPMAHQLSCTNSTAQIVHVFHNMHRHLTEAHITMSLILEALKEIVLCCFLLLLLHPPIRSERS